MPAHRVAPDRPGSTEALRRGSKPPGSKWAATRATAHFAPLALLFGLDCAEREPEVDLCEPVVTCLEAELGLAPPHAVAECETATLSIERLDEALGLPPPPPDNPRCDALEGCEATFCRAEALSRIRQWECDDYPVSGGCSCIAWPLDSTSPLSFAPGEVCRESNCCFALSAETSDPARGPITACGCVGGNVDPALCRQILSEDEDLVAVDTCPPTMGCALEGSSCAEQPCCPGSLCRTSPSGESRCEPATDEALDAAACEAVASGRAFEGLRVVQAALDTNVGRFEFDRLDYALLETGGDGCIGRLNLGLLSPGGDGRCALLLSVEQRGEALEVTSADALLGDCPSYEGGLFNDLYSGGGAERSGIELTFDGVTCPQEEEGAHCLSGRFDFHFSGVSGDPLLQQAVIFEDAHVIVEGTRCPARRSLSCGPDPFER